MYPSGDVSSGVYIDASERAAKVETQFAKTPLALSACRELRVYEANKKKFRALQCITLSRSLYYYAAIVDIPLFGIIMHLVSAAVYFLMGLFRNACNLGTAVW